MDRETETERDLISTVDLWCNPEDGVTVVNNITRLYADTDGVVTRLNTWVGEVCHSPATHLRHLLTHHTLITTFSIFVETHTRPLWGWGTPLPPLSIYFLIFSPFYFFPFFPWLYLFFFFCPSLPFLPEYSHSVSRPEVVGGDRTWV